MLCTFAWKLIFDSQKFIQLPPYFILALHLHIYVALIKWWSVCYSSKWKVYDTINDHVLACKWSIATYESTNKQNDYHSYRRRDNLSGNRISVFIHSM